MAIFEQIQEFIANTEPGLILLMTVGVALLFLVLMRIWQKLMRVITTLLIIACVGVALYLILVEGVLW